MNQEDKTNNSNEKSLLDRIKQVALVVGTVIGVISGTLVIIQGADLYIRSHKEPNITITNHLALPIIVVVNDSTAYTYRVEPNAQKIVTLYSELDFPAKIHWSTIRNKNGGVSVGEALSGDYLKIDKGRKINVTNVLGADVYFYPVINNNSDEKCKIVINDGLTTQKDIGTSNAHRKTNITGYFKKAKNSNITLYCNDKPYWVGIRNGQGSAKNLPSDAGSGVTEITIP